MIPLPRIYLLGAITALGLGLLLLGRQVVAPVPAATTGCLTADFDSSEESLRPRWAEVHLRACPHFDETTLELWIAAPLDSETEGGLIFTGSGPADPRLWPQYLRLNWVSRDTLRIDHTAEVHFLDRNDTVGPIRILYGNLVAGPR
jgi:hypothetical protein